jgi:hypothetical protein
MDFIHTREYLEAGHAVRVDCEIQCNVMLTDDANFNAYRRRQRFTYYGGHFKAFPALLRPPHAGYWNVTIDLAGRSANIRYNISKLG